MKKLGVIGGGQLGLMLAQEAVQLGLKVICLDPSDDPPARQSAEHWQSAFDDMDMLRKLAAQCDVVTYEFENLSVTALQQAGCLDKIRPGIEALRVSQDRLIEKRYFSQLGIPTVPYFPVTGPLDFEQAATFLAGRTGILKTRCLGYDGKGQTLVDTVEDLRQGWEECGRVPCIVESKIPFDFEFSVIVARSLSGECRFYPLSINEHQHGILRVARKSCSEVQKLYERSAYGFTQSLAAELQYVGVLALEFFACQGKIFANEFAPRVHNSGHWTMHSDLTSQFGNHVRAVCGYPLGYVSTGFEAAMVNLIGTLPSLADILAIEGCHPFLYHKSPRAGRKLGHVTIVAPGADLLSERISKVQALLK